MAGSALAHGLAEALRLSALKAQKMQNLRPATRSAVFGSYELLELILLALPPEDLLIAAHVSKFWYSLVTSSSAIDQRLQATPFFLLEESEEYDYSDSPQLVHLMFECADVVIQRIDDFEAVALVRNQRLKHGETFLIKFFESDEPIPGLNDDDYGALRLGWAAAFRWRLNPFLDQSLLNRLEYGLFCMLHPEEAAKDKEHRYETWKDYNQRWRDRVQFKWKDAVLEDSRAAKVLDFELRYMKLK